jgi:N-acetylglucosaminyldiphosphoundecaprenol N-acetyl-beta-D-mannosaminyltransferase
MINIGKFPILGVNVDAVDYAFTVQSILDAAEAGKPLAVSATAVHGLVLGLRDPVHARRLNGLDLVVPDGQPVRWALRWLYGASLQDRVYGPNLTVQTVQALTERGWGVYLYGSTPPVLARFAERLKGRFPGLIVSGMEASKFRRLNEEERNALVTRIRASGARAVLVGLGCPRQEVWAYEYRNDLSMPILAVGAAFDFHAGTLPQAPRFLQDRGLEWLFRLAQEPRRLWRRYLLNPLYLWNIALQWARWKRFSPAYPDGSETIESFG